MRRLVLMLALAAGVVTAVVGFADAAKPTAGDWRSAHASFTVNAARTRITNFSSRCAGVPLPISMKVKPNGAFSYSRRLGLQGGKPLPVKVTGRFTSATRAKVTGSFGRCHERFTATIKVAPVQSVPTDTTTN